MKIRLIALLAVVAMAVMAAPASADTGVGAFIGTATVSPGLHLPGVPTVSGSWSLLVDVTGVPASGTLDASGDLGPIANVLGAACGASEGSNGSGTFGHHSLTDLGWAATAGGTLPVTGNYDGGVVAAVVQAQGGAACVSDAGAEEFQVVGVAALIGD